jgi:hypothetical protein
MRNNTEKGQLFHSREEPFLVPQIPPQIQQELLFKPGSTRGEAHKKLIMFGTQEFSLSLSDTTS